MLSKRTAFYIVLAGVFSSAFVAKDPDWMLRISEKQVDFKKIQKLAKSNPLASDIYISNGAIDVFPKELFQLERLRLLMLGNIQFGNTEQFNTDLCGCEHLTKLQLNSTNQTTLNLWDECKLLYLRELTIVSLKLKELKIRPWNPSLKMLTIFDTELTTLPEKFETIDHLESLTISKNPNMDLSKELPKIKTQKRLKTLALAYNNLTSIPEEVFTLKTLEELQLHGNDFTAFDERLTTLPNLKILKFSQNKTPFSDQLKKEFAEKLPDCNIQY